MFFSTHYSLIPFFLANIGIRFVLAGLIFNYVKNISSFLLQCFFVGVAFAIFAGACFNTLEIFTDFTNYSINFCETYFDSELMCVGKRPY